MARNKHNRQVNVPLPRGSAMERFYIQEARENGVGLPTHLYQVLKRRFETMEARHVEEPVQSFNTTNIHTNVAEAFKAFGGEEED